MKKSVLFVAVIFIICAFIAGLNISNQNEYKRGWDEAMEEVWEEYYYNSEYSKYWNGVNAEVVE